MIRVSDGRWKSVSGAGGGRASPLRNSRIALGVERRARNQLAKNGLDIALLVHYASVLYDRDPGSSSRSSDFFDEKSIGF